KRGAATAGSRLSALGLVRWRLLRILEMNRHGFLVLGVAALWLSAFLWTTIRADTSQVAHIQPRVDPGAAHIAMFAPPNDCVACHNNLVAPSGEDVSIGAGWRGTMMANSARDPYVLASVRREMLDHPRRASDIEDECATCH